MNNFVRFLEHVLIKYKIDDNGYNKQYQLMGFVVHIDPSIAQGHYVFYFRAGGNWMKANYETITTISFQYVHLKKAYILFY